MVLVVSRFAFDGRALVLIASVNAYLLVLSFFCTPVGLISVFLLAAQLKLEITVSSIWLSSPVQSASLKRF